MGGLSASLRDGQRFRIAAVSTPDLSSIQGAPYIVSRVRIIPPAGATSELFDLRCDVLLDKIPSQVILVSTQTDWRTSTFANDPQLLGVLRAQDRIIEIDRREGNWWRGFGSIFRLGMRHIAEVLTISCSCSRCSCPHLF